MVLFFGVLSFVFETNSEQVHGQDQSNQKIELKKRRSEFSMKELHDFITDDLSRPTSRGSIKQVGGSIRTIHGRLVDHQGNPIVDAVVVFVERIGYGFMLYDENFDRTDKEGRFVVQGHEDREALVFKRDKMTWRVGVPSFDRKALKPEYQSVQWPVPSTCRIKPAKEFIHKQDQKFELTTTEMWAGMTPLKLKTKLKNGVASFENVPPASYSVVTNIPIKKANDEMGYGRAQIGVIKVEEGDDKDFEIAETGRVVQGTIVWKDAEKVRISTAKTKYKSVEQQVDLAFPKDGSFKTRKLPPGKYTLRIQFPEPALAPGEVAPPRGRIQVSRKRSDIVRALEVTEGTDVQTVSYEEAKFIVKRVHEILESKPTGSWSHLDVQRSQLVPMRTSPDVVDELIRIVDDHAAPANWRYVAKDSLGYMTQNEKVADLLVRKLDGPDAFSFISACRHCTLETAKRVLPKLRELTQSPVSQTRGSAYNTLAHLGAKHKSLIKEIAPMLLTGLDDSVTTTQTGAIMNLGSWKVKEALPKLKELKKNPPSQALQVQAAIAIWRIDGDQEQAIDTMIEVLFSNDIDGKQSAAYSLSLFSNLPKRAIDALEATANYKADPPSKENSRQEKNLRASAKQTLDKVRAQAEPKKKK